MVADQETPSITFSGSETSQKLASTAFDVMRGRGMFMSANAPIRVPLEALNGFLAQQANASAEDVLAALTENSAIFAIEETEEGPFVQTTRAGHAPVLVDPSQEHSFKTRFLTPEPKPEKPETPRREPTRANPSWASFSIPEGYEDSDEEELDEQPAATFGADDLDLTIEPLEDVAVETPIVATPEPTPVAAEPVVTEVIVEPAPAAAPAGAAIADATDEEVAAALVEQLAGDAHVAQFGNQWMVEERVPRLSRGDLRKIKEYIEEQEQPLTDETLVQDILGVRGNAPDFDLMSFAVNFRLSREHKEFDFVGTGDQRFWSTTSLQPIGTSRRKPNEIGTDFRYLLDEAPIENAEYRSVSSIDHVVTFYEFNLGLLPYDADLQRLLPKPVTPDQRSAVLTFEIPQLYTTYLAELRYPTPNRGGFLLGLDDFYQDSLVPGAVIAITATENDGHYKVEFIAAKDRSERLLELDDRRTPRYTFRPTTFACEVADEWLISEDRFPNLGSEKPLDDRIRRRPEAVIEATFERIGIDDGNGGRVAAFADLLAAANVERPFSTALLQATLDQHPDVTADGDTYTYASES